MIKKLIILGIVILLPFCSAKSQNSDFDLGKTLEVQSTILRLLNTQYVDTLKLDDLLTDGIRSMLSSLDPYTVFISEEEEDNIEMLTTGAYGGVGAIIRKVPSGGIMVSEVYENTPAVKYGIEPGDTIIKIGDDSTFDKDVTTCSQLMRGRPGSKIPMTIIKGRGGDTITVDLERERIHVSDVAYYGFVDDTTGYILLGGFTLRGSEDVKKAYMELNKSGHLKRLVLDLRGNGGGLMSEAVDILSLFLPKGTLVVSAKGKHPESNFEYRTQKAPIDTTIPLMVMVNSASASSSEIVAGAIQDLDRGVIAGERTYGKGLVQSIRSTGYNTSLKLTTAKYYTPSGRCVQAIDYSHKSDDGSVGNFPDSLRNEFRTSSGRIVYDGGGIAPDLEVPSIQYSRPIIGLVYSDVLGEYAVEYYKHHEEIEPADRFHLTDAEYEDFVQYASAIDFDSRSMAYIEMQEVLRQAQKEGLLDENKQLKETLENALAALSESKEEFLINNKALICPLLEDEIVLKYFYTRGGAESALRTDEQLHQALKSWSVTDVLTNKN